MPPSFGPLLNGESSVLHAALGRVGGDLQGTCRWNRRCRRRALGPALVDALVDPGGDSEGNPGRRSSNQVRPSLGNWESITVLENAFRTPLGLSLDQLLGDEVGSRGGSALGPLLGNGIGITVMHSVLHWELHRDFSSVSH
jgi:hypothetical protein